MFQMNTNITCRVSPNDRKAYCCGRRYQIPHCRPLKFHWPNFFPDNPALVAFSWSNSPENIQLLVSLQFPNAPCTMELTFIHHIPLRFNAQLVEDIAYSSPSSLHHSETNVQ